MAGLIAAAQAELIIRDAPSQADALAALARLPRIEPRSMEIPAQFAALQEVMNELLRQDAKWGEQNHPDGTGATTQPLRRIANAHSQRGRFAFHPHEEMALTLANDAKAANDADVSFESVTWTGILLEELFEALAEEVGSTELRTELIQTAAVCVQWVLAIDRRGEA